MRAVNSELPDCFGKILEMCNFGYHHFPNCNFQKNRALFNDATRGKVALRIAAGGSEFSSRFDTRVLHAAEPPVENKTRDNSAMLMPQPNALNS